MHMLHLPQPVGGGDATLPKAQNEYLTRGYPLCLIHHQFLFTNKMFIGNSITGEYLQVVSEMGVAEKLGIIFQLAACRRSRFLLFGTLISQINTDF
jgi:hypothetical protein